MTARTHDAFAFTFLVTGAALYPPESINLYTLFAAVIGNVMGGMIPDLDTAGNRIWGFLPAGKSLGKVLRRLFYKHRTVTHSLIGMYVIFLFLQWIIPKLFNPEFIDHTILLVSIMIGYVSHLFADSLTEDGIPLFFPINFDFGIPPVRRIRITTGSWFEKFVVLPLLGIYIVWLINNFSETFKSVLANIG